ncbi:MAG: hypothetical protein AB7K24_33405 [Gemmataceae bacterium]
MNRPIICCLLTVLLPVLGSSTATPVDTSAPKAPQLSDKDRERWQKLRKTSPAPYIIAGYIIKSKSWQIALWDTKLDIHSWQSKLDLWSKDDKEIAEATAKEIALKDGTAKVTAVIDLFTEDAPKAMAFYYKDEAGLYTSRVPPSAEIGAALKAFLLGVQKDPVVAKPDSN